MRSAFRCATVSLALVVLFGISLPGYPESGRSETEAGPDSTQQYLGGLFQSLMAQPTPRRLILASTLRDKLGTELATNAPSRAELALLATQQAPTDVVVQWQVAMHLGAMTLLAVKQPLPPDVTDAATRLLDIDADNGVAWLVPLAVAWQSKNDDEITAMLEKIASANRFEDYSVNLVLEWLPLLRAEPFPRQGLPPMAVSDEAIALMAAHVLILTPNRPLPQHLLDACRPDMQLPSPRRRDACLAVGRLVSDKANTLANRRVGVELLRVAGKDDVDYLRARRELDWLDVQGRKALESVMNDLAGIQRFEADLRETHSEVEAARRLLARRGVAPSPADDWQAGQQARMPGIGD